MSCSVQSRDPYINTPSTFRNLCRGLNLKQYIYMSAYNDTILFTIEVPVTLFEDSGSVQLVTVGITGKPC